MVKKHNILIIGAMARDHAIGWKLRESPRVGKIYFAPGNAGTALVGKNTGIPLADFKGLVDFAIKNDIALSLCTQDDTLSAGVANAFKEKGLKIFGATKEAAQIESSKAFAKQLMREENIPTAKYETFSDASDAKKYVKKHGAPIVIKASGLALGKGVTIARTVDEAINAIDEIMVKKIFGSAGNEVVIEEFMEGKEISIHAFSDGNSVALFPTSRDYKPIFEGNKGPNTGGMGTIAPVSGITDRDLEEIKKKIVLPAIKGLKKRGILFTGCLYPGLMITKEGFKVVEFNCRFGEPEMDSYMRLLKTDLFEILLACVEGKLSEVKIEWHDKYSCCIVLASAGYPESSHKGDVIKGLEKFKNNSDIVVFHFATKEEEGQLVTNGGRVLGVTATGRTLNAALKKAYSAIGPKKINFEGMQYRKDIGKI
jgi:phosphoribosylamine---glycine ligase